MSRLIGTAQSTLVSSPSSFPFRGLQCHNHHSTMFDGYESVPNSGEDSSGKDVCFHISVLVEISKRVAAMHWSLCAWNLNPELQQRFREFLEARGVNDKLSVFLHEYMMNKD
ncbi:hypothetical protein P3X46_019290 [Hevea brasiliensis]|uniref:Uncharacterized protein n=1 Tax=Hevea brasiliensis TaxID=3981 RepID=A0ABQ9LM41_HEVBR|nr:hypothetical protein P3X46_019290 [Hevea brasiliensis]